MKITELRIGNLVLDSTKHVHRIERLDEKWDFGDRFPINLSEEYLIKFGFKKIGYRFEKDNFRLYPQAEGYYEFLKLHIYCDGEFDEHLYILICNITFVHQLQNLYFTLCGEELVFFN